MIGSIDMRLAEFAAANSMGLDSVSVSDVLIVSMFFCSLVDAAGPLALTTACPGASTRSAVNRLLALPFRPGQFSIMHICRPVLSRWLWCVLFLSTVSLYHLTKGGSRFSRVLVCVARTFSSGAHQYLSPVYCSHFLPQFSSVSLFVQFSTGVDNSNLTCALDDDSKVDCGFSGINQVRTKRVPLFCTMLTYVYYPHIVRK